VLGRASGGASGALPAAAPAGAGAGAAFALRVISAIPLVTFPADISVGISFPDTTIPLGARRGKLPARPFPLPKRLNLVVVQLHPGIRSQQHRRLSARTPFSGFSARVARASATAASDRPGVMSCGSTSQPATAGPAAPHRGASVAGGYCHAFRRSARGDCSYRLPVNSLGVPRYAHQCRCRGFLPRCPLPASAGMPIAKGSDGGSESPKDGASAVRALGQPCWSSNQVVV
jgi:hypothetical protein